MWLAIALAVLTAYSLSCGPIFWTLHRSGRTTGAVWNVCSAVYWPVFKAIDSTPPPIARMLSWWCGL
jgi:hypothetical protein